MACCAEERADGEIGEDEGDDRVEDEAVVRGTGLPVGAELPEVAGEEECEEGEEEACNFKPEHAGGVGEGSPDGEAEAARSFAHAASPFLVDGSLFLDVIRALLGFSANEASEKSGAYPHGSANSGCLHGKSLEHSAGGLQDVRGLECGLWTREVGGMGRNELRMARVVRWS